MIEQNMDKKITAISIVIKAVFVDIHIVASYGYQAQARKLCYNNNCFTKYRL